MRNYHRISVNIPFSNTRMWAVGSSDHIRIETVAHEYPARDVPEVISRLKRVLVGDAVITVY